MGQWKQAPFLNITSKSKVKLRKEPAINAKSSQHDMRSMKMQLNTEQTVMSIKAHCVRNSKNCLWLKYLNWLTFHNPITCSRCSTLRYRAIHFPQTMQAVLQQFTRDDMSVCCHALPFLAAWYSQIISYHLVIYPNIGS
jgi:hypothetical protein